MTTLSDIIAAKRRDVDEAKRQLPLVELQRQSTGLIHASRFAKGIMAAPKLAIIAEIKLASPTHPALGEREDILDRAAAYEAARADAISYITEEHYFGGDLADIAKLKQRVALPILQKDFVVDPYQIYQARVAGSDALLLIARLVSGPDLQLFVATAQELGLEPVVEIHDSDDLEKAVATTTRFIAVNARDLDSFAVDIAAACELLRQIPQRFVALGFSGINSGVETAQYHAAGARSALVGTRLMQAADIRQFLHSLRV